MSAGHSAADQAAHYRLTAEAHEFAAVKAREMYRRYSAASDSESRLGALLEPLQDQGYFVLSDRAWPNSAKAQVDFVVVGPSGVFIVDAKAWADVTVAAGRVFQGQDDVTDRFENIASLAPVTQAALAEVGVTAGEVAVLAVFTNRRGELAEIDGVSLVGMDVAVRRILARGSRLAPTQVKVALQVLEQLFPLLGGRDQQPLELTALAPVIPITQENALISIKEIEESLLAGILAKPIEEWMAFLHPDQARLVRRSFNGPSRIRGAAGTGKTVVGLHRAAYIARTRPGTVLVTTFVKTLPDVLSNLLARMAPEVADRVEFSGVHAFALKLLRDRGVEHSLDGKAAERAFEQAWRTVGRAGPLARIDGNSDYWRDEILCVIKGRGLTRFERYATLPRPGRKRGLTAENRFAVWELFTAYDAELRRTGSHDFADVILLAEASLRATPLLGYSAVIIDEAQDLSCAMIRMLHLLVGDRADGLNLIGDGQQTIYPGGYTLSEAHISIAGRGVIMNRNYRNTIEIAEFAASLVAEDEFVDIEGDARLGDIPVQILRHGPKPMVSRFSSRTGHDRSLVAHVRTILDEGTRAGDIGILATTNWATSDVTNALSAAGIPSINLLKYDGRQADAVKIGTIKRAKGLEFKHVLVARTPARLLEPVAANSDPADGERRALDRRELYVAMTRARDGLWVGVA